MLKLRETAGKIGEEKAPLQSAEIFGSSSSLRPDNLRKSKQYLEIVE